MHYHFQLLFMICHLKRIHCPSHKACGCPAPLYLDNCTGTPCACQDYNKIKAHHYIIIFDPQAAIDRGLTWKRAVEYVRKNFSGHQALICTHMNGHNGSGNIHVHIIINSLR